MNLPSEAPAPKRRGLRFSLRTLFIAMTVLAIGLGIRANWRPNCIHQRHELLERQAANYRGCKMSNNPAPGFSHVPPEAAPRQWPNLLTHIVLWIFGEPAIPEVRLYGSLHSPQAFHVGAAEIVRAKWLFPEADIRVCVTHK